MSTTPAAFRDRILAMRKVAIDAIDDFEAGNPVDRTALDIELLDASLLANGYAMPIMLREKAAGRYETIDGHGRVARIRVLWPEVRELNAIILDVRTAGEGRKLLLGLRHSAEWGMAELDEWMRTALEDGDLVIDEAMALSGLSAADLDSLADACRDLLPDPPPALDPKIVDVAGHTRQIGGHAVRPPAQMTNEDWSVLLGDCLEGLRQLADNSTDSLVTDPPAGISFMAREWDDDKGGRDKWIEWLSSVMAECVRVLKPGGHGLVWCLPRTQHWTMLALERAGFEIRDVVYHAFGTGFPKSLNISKAIDAHLGMSAERQVIGVNPNSRPNMVRVDASVLSPRVDAPISASATEQAEQAEGWGTALKPAIEPWILVRKPLCGTVAENFLKWGTGGINIDETRIGVEERHNGPVGGHADDGATYELGMRGKGEGTAAIGRWPAHLVLSHTAACVFVGVEDEERPMLEPTGRDGDVYGAGLEGSRAVDPVVVSRDVYRCAPDCPARLLDEQSGHTTSSDNVRNNGAFQSTSKGAETARVSHGHADSGGASRFFYVAKPARAETEAGLSSLPERSGGELTARKDGSDGLESPRAGAGRGGGRRNIHPTKKPIELMRYFVRLVTPRGGLVLDPFAGSGTTGLAALVEACRFIGFEKDPEYHAIAEARLRSIIDDPRAVETADDDQDPDHP